MVSSRVLTILVVLLFITTLIQLPIIIWKFLSEKTDEESTEYLEYSEINVNTAYPGYFRNDTKQQQYERQILKSFLFSRTNVTESVFKPFPTSTCLVQQQGNSGRKKRGTSSSGINGVYHGCCVSWITFDVPSTMTNIKGEQKTIVQFVGKRQYFINHHCEYATGCTGCTCSQEYNYVTAVVHKAGVSSPGYVKDVEVDSFFLDGCCKCVNT